MIHSDQALVLEIGELASGICEALNITPGCLVVGSGLHKLVKVGNHLIPLGASSTFCFHELFPEMLKLCPSVLGYIILNVFDKLCQSNFQGGDLLAIRREIRILERLLVAVL